MGVSVVARNGFLSQGCSMVRQRCDRGYDWMLQLSAEGWAWEFLRRNPAYRDEYLVFRNADPIASSRAAHGWGLLQFVNPAEDARTAIVFWCPAKNPSVLPLATGGKGSNCLAGAQCKVSVLELPWSGRRHVLCSCGGRFLQLAIAGQGDLTQASYVMDDLPKRSSDPKLLALRRLADLTHHKRLRPELYGRQKRGPRLARIAEVLDISADYPAHRSIARAVFGGERANQDWDNVRDHIRRALAAGRSLVQGGYLEFLG